MFEIEGERESDGAAVFLIVGNGEEKIASIYRHGWQQHRAAADEVGVDDGVTDAISHEIRHNAPIMIHV